METDGDQREQRPGQCWLDRFGRHSGGARTYYLLLSQDQNPENGIHEWRAAAFRFTSGGWNGAPVVILWPREVAKLHFLGELSTMTGSPRAPAAILTEMAAALDKDDPDAAGALQLLRDVLEKRRSMALVGPIDPPAAVEYEVVFNRMMYRPAGPAPSDGRRCENCRHWSPIEDDPHSEGLCRRDPPAIQTSRGQCCGEWASTPPSPTPPEGEPTR